MPNQAKIAFYTCAVPLQEKNKWSIVSSACWHTGQFLSSIMPHLASLSLVYCLPCATSVTKKIHLGDPGLL